MDAFLHQIFSGLANGCIYGSIALALVMIYQATHHLNFAQGEMATFSTFIAWALVQTRHAVLGARSPSPSAVSFAGRRADPAHHPAPGREGAGADQRHASSSACC